MPAYELGGKGGERERREQKKGEIGEEKKGGRERVEEKGEEREDR